MDVLPRISTARQKMRATYLAYLKTPTWRHRRDRALQHAHWCCERCASKRSLEVHHKTYARLGAEHDDDLEVLCLRCHEHEHIAQVGRSPLAVYLKLARFALDAAPLASIADLSEMTKVLCVRQRIPYDGPVIHRTLHLITGHRALPPLTPQMPQPDAPANDRPLTAMEVHEVLARLKLLDCMRTMPAVEPSPEAAQAHEDRVRAQAEVFRRVRPRRNLRRVLDAIFAGGR